MSKNKCGHCKLVGHNQSNCAKATLDASYFYQRIRDIKEAEASTVKDRLSNYFNNFMTVHNLTILMKYVELKLVPFIKKLIEKQKITEQEANFRLKKDRIKVLMWYFWFASKKYQEYRKNPPPPPTKKLDIIAKSFELETDLSSFECPICVDCKPGKERTVTNCNHEVCKTCVDQYLEHQVTTLNFPQPRCSLCRTMITTIAFANTDYIDEVSNKYFKVHILM
jgi:hypothetical protein